MRFSFFSLLAVASLAVAPGLRADLVTDLTFTLDNSGVGSGYSANQNPDADCYSVPQLNCVVFTGTLADTDNDPNDAGDANDIQLLDIYAIFSSSPATGSLALDNTFASLVPGALTGDPNWATDAENLFPGAYTEEPIFGVTIAPGTTPGSYSGTVYIDATCGDDDPNCGGFTVSQNFTVDVLSPEPGAFGLLFAGLLPLAGWLTMKRKWRSPASSR